MSNEVINKVKSTNQKYLKKNLENIPVKVMSQLENMDWTYLDLINQEVKPRGTFSPIEAMELSEIEANKSSLKEKGLEAIKAGKVAAILLAGGQGTRLGFDKAKGMFNIGETKELYIFEQLINNMMDVTNDAGCFIPLYIMTSEKNDKDTREFFEEHNYFGYDKNFVKFFVQDMAPATDFEGNLLLESEDSLAMSPNGNGGWFNSLIKAGLDEELKAKGIEWLNVFGVDNVLQRIADPVFVGATLESGCECASKVVRKANPDEKVGALCLENGKPSIVEYYELTPEMAEARNEKGTLLYGFGVTLNYLFKVEKLREISKNSLLPHIVKKKVPYLTEEGKLVKPEEPNAYKFELLIIDMIYMMDNCLGFEVERNKEFAPVKNAKGIDSVDTARELLKINGVNI
ncbi:UTP--glucose-1-phosphate uridylyltransferase [Lachnobacterium bovis]|uniref:UDP-N-acetylglucosamine/UDP-N-acetylgalactosamine diphosphorylase n=1 Tax=Lachnobacterium bovis DSM 14045 TaxID=1122142 RepID=A0A1H3JPI7_9FIRM|nr:UDPGP type 1 family protein [Lachnobacterium bovis]SDY41852.1 UDP-N-acetylglucosamine/UDP-N-acetylgalactosaminediphosphorylase [Lachnobacterium bovis DSM 14045]